MSPRASPLDNDGKPCKQCTSFQDYVKASKEKLKAETEVGDDNEMCKPEEDPALLMANRRPDCPLDKDELGNKTWGLLHTMAAKFPERPSCDEQKDMKTFFSVFSKFYPCEHCAADLRVQLKKDPPKVENQDVFSQWLCRLHNKINVKTGKPEFDCSKVNERWRDGWLDGSCDY